MRQPDALSGFSLGGVAVGFPLASTFFCVLFASLPFGTIGGLPWAPFFVIIAIYYWVLCRPNLFHPVYIFAFGITQELLTGAPLGLMAFIYMLVFAITLSQRRAFIGTAGYPVWLGFAIVAGVATVLMWILGTLYFGTFVNVLGLLTQFISTIIFFPLFERLFAWLNAQIPEEA